MKTVFYFEYVRNKKKFIANAVSMVGMFAGLFVVTMVVDLVLPTFNINYMHWPDYLQNLIGLSFWQGRLYANVWNLIAVMLPFYLMYYFMNSTATAIVEEERLETIVFLRNLSITRKQLMIAKLLCRIIVAFGICFLLMIENILFFGILKMIPMIWVSVRYFSGMFLISILYMAIATFGASYKKTEAECMTIHSNLLLYPFLIARVPAFLYFIASLLELGNKQTVIVEQVRSWADRLLPLEMVFPMMWCWPGYIVSVWEMIFGVLVTLIMFAAGYCIYTREKVIFRG